MKEVSKVDITCPEDEAYLKYINTHRTNINNAFRKHGKIICLCLSLVNFAYFKLMNNISNHDISKYDSTEFLPYRKKFFPKADEQSSDTGFSEAWKHHYSNNPHHWEYWVKNGKAKEMDRLSIAEMLLDWEAMGVYNKNSPVDFYNANKDRINLGKQTRKLVESTLQKLKETREFPYNISKHAFKRRRFRKEKK